MVCKKLGSIVRQSSIYDLIMRVRYTDEKGRLVDYETPSSTTNVPWKAIAGGAVFGLMAIMGKRVVRIKN